MLMHLASASSIPESNSYMHTARLVSCMIASYDSRVVPLVLDAFQDQHLKGVDRIHASANRSPLNLAALTTHGDRNKLTIAHRDMRRCATAVKLTPNAFSYQQSH